MAQRRRLTDGEREERRRHDRARLDLLKERESLAVWLGGLTVSAACFSLVDIPLWTSLAAAVAWAGYSTRAEVSRDRAAQTKTRSTLGVVPKHVCQ